MSPSFEAEIHRVSTHAHVSVTSASTQLTYEKSPAYLGDPRAPYIAFALLPSVKLIAILR